MEGKNPTGIKRWVPKRKPALVTPFHNATELEANEWPENYLSRINLDTRKAFGTINHVTLK